MTTFLLKQLFLSNLNIFSGADPKEIEDILDDADQWFQEYLPDEQLSEEFQLSGMQLAQKLTEFNPSCLDCASRQSTAVEPKSLDLK